MTHKIVKENMSSDLITIGWDEPMEGAYRRMKAAKVRHLPVLSSTGEVVGMLSDRDVQRSMISQLRPGRHGTPNSGFAQSEFKDETIEFDANSRVRDYMSWPALSVDQSTDLARVAEKMISEKVSSVLVTKNGKTVGIVTVEDLMVVLIELLKGPSAPLNLDLDQLLFGRLANLRTTLF